MTMTGAAFSFLEVALTVSILLLGLVWFFNKKKKDPRCPPGPPTLPFIGNLHQLASKPQRAMVNFAEQYGPCFSIRLGCEEVVVLNDHQLVKNVFADMRSAGRTSNPVFLAFANGNYGVVFAEGAHWEQQRRFTIRSLRDFGYAKTAMEGMILEEVNSMVRYFDKRINTPTSGYRIFNGPVVNSLWNIITGERNEWDSPDKPPVLKEAEEIVGAVNYMNKTGLFFLPILRFIAPDYMGWTWWIQALKGLTGLCSEATEKHKAQLNPESPKDFLDHYLIEMAEAKDPSSSFYKENGDRMSWALLLLANNPQVQRKLQNEIDTVIGPGRQPSVSDRPNLPYTEAVIMEVLRMTSVVNLGAPHRMTVDTVIDGYFFPKNTTVFSNIWYIHNNPKIWGDPENFRPERFLSSDEKQVIRPETFLPFSLGRRQCLGKSLAEDTLFLFSTCIFQKYTVTPDPASCGKELRRIEPTEKMVNEPDDFKIIINHRTDV